MPKHAEFSPPAIFLITIPTSFPPPPFKIITKFFLPFLFSYSCSVRYRRNDLGKKYDLIRPRVRPCVSAVARHARVNVERNHGNRERRR